MCNMFCITHQERKVLLFIGVLILAGSLLRFYKAGVKDGSSGSIKAVTASEDRSYKSPININKASQKELESISGIGEVIAGRIIEYRFQCGLFKDFNDVKKVKGIGDKKIEIIGKYIVF